MKQLEVVLCLDLIYETSLYYHAERYIKVRRVGSPAIAVRRKAARPTESEARRGALVSRTQWVGRVTSRAHVATLTPEQRHGTAHFQLACLAPGSRREFR